MSILTRWRDRGSNDGVSPFDQIRHEDEQGEFWWAREMGERFTYSRWADFRPVVEKAIENAFGCGMTPEDHIRIMPHMVEVGSGALRQVEDFRLSRRGCYLVAINSDSSKPIVAAAKNYFVIRTRQAELAEEAFRKQGPIRVSETPWFSRVVYQRSAHAILLTKYASNRFTVFSEAWQYLLEAEKIIMAHELPTLSSDLMDGSIGSRFAKFFENQTGLRNVERHAKVTVEVDGVGRSIEPLLWDLKYLPMFRQWLMDTYFPKCFIEYLQGKASLKASHELAKASAADRVSIAFTDKPANLKENYRVALNANGNSMITDSMAKRMVSNHA